VERLEDYPAEVPTWVEFLTLGGDVQSGDTNPAYRGGVYGWGRGLECWLIGHFVLSGDPGNRARSGPIWTRSWVGSLHGRRQGLKIQAAAIDSGGHHTAETYAFCNERRGRRVWAIKGRAEIKGKRTKVWPRKPSPQARERLVHGRRQRGP
jgi:phage terminase large subunit GpA-like protein